MSKPWSGEQELQSALQNLSGQYPIPNSKVKSAVVVANKYVNEFKMVVYEIERFIKKANNEDKIGGLYVLDMLCRQSGKEKDIFAKRFAVRLKETVGYLTKVSNQDKAGIHKVLEEWKRNHIFPSDVLSTIKLEDFAVAGVSTSHKEKPESSRSTAPSSSSSSSKVREESTSLKKEAPAAEIKKKPAKEEKLKKVTNQVIKKAVRMCPFRDGNCPFGDKCRFNHHETNTLEQYAARLSRTIGLKRIILDESDSSVFEVVDGMISSSKRDLPNDMKVEFQCGSTFHRKRLKVDYNPSPMMPAQPTFYEIEKTIFDELFLKST